MHAVISVYLVVPGKLFFDPLMSHVVTAVCGDCGEILIVGYADSRSVLTPEEANMLLSNDSYRWHLDQDGNWYCPSCPLPF